MHTGYWVAGGVLVAGVVGVFLYMNMNSSSSSSSSQAPAQTQPAPHGTTVHQLGQGSAADAGAAERLAWLGFVGQILHEGETIYQTESQFRSPYGSYPTNVSGPLAPK